MRDVTLTAHPEHGCVTLNLPVEIIPNPLPAGADALCVRFKTAEGFRRFMVAAMDAAAKTWPDIAAEWFDA